MSDTQVVAPTPELPDILRRYVQGESVQNLAAESKVSRRTIYRWMLAGTGDGQYYDLVTQALVNRIADADFELDTASDPCHIARAREAAKFARMDFERRRRKLYGAKDEEAQTGITIVIADGMPRNSVAITQQSAQDVRSERDELLITEQVIDSK